MNELINRLLFLGLALLIYRFGVHVPVPGVSSEQLNLLFSESDTTFIGLFNIFSGGALMQMSIFSLGIVPYISSSIAMQLLQYFIPHFHSLSKEGANGRMKLNQYTRLLTLGLAIFQSFAFCIALGNKGVFVSGSVLVFINAVSCIAIGSLFLMWLGEKINERGIGNGISMLIFVSIVSSLPSVIFSSIEQARQGAVSVFAIIVIVLFLLLLSFLIVFFERAQRKLPLGYSNRAMAHQQGVNVTGSQFLPLKINMAGIIPIIFASSMLLLPYSVAQWLGDRYAFLNEVVVLLSPNQPLYLVVYVFSVFFFCFFYVSLMFNTSEVAKNLKQSNAFILGIRPGIATEQYLDKVVGNLTFVGASYIASVSLFPQFLSVIVNVPFIFAGTSILIVISVVMDFITQIQSHLFSMQYASVLNKAKFSR